MYGCSRVLVSGGAGFIGSHIVDRLLTEGIEVVVLDNLEGGRLENIRHHISDKRFRFVRGDVRDFCSVEDLVKGVDAVFHQAALVSVPQSIDNPVLVNEVNVDGTLNLLKAALDSKVKRFIFAASCAIYGDADVLPIKEDSPLKPKSPYGVSKLAAENYVHVFWDVYHLETVCLRYFNVYGPRQVHNQYSGVMTQFLKNLKENRSLVIFGDGEQTRDFVHVQDVAEANLLALERKGIAGETFNIATGVPTTINQLARTMIEVTRKNVETVHSEPKEGEIKHSFADITKARRKLQYTPNIALREGLGELAENCSIMT